MHWPLAKESCRGRTVQPKAVSPYPPAYGGVQRTCPNASDPLILAGNSGPINDLLWFLNSLLKGYVVKLSIVGL